VKATGTVQALASFDGAKGKLPGTGVTFDASGNLFGTTDPGGANNLGVVWELAKGSNTITPYASFTGPTGTNPTGAARPFGQVVFDSNGNMFGTTVGGGSFNQYGTVWEIKARTQTITTLATFQNGSTGSSPLAGVAIDSMGDLFGTAVSSSAEGTSTSWTHWAEPTATARFGSFPRGATHSSC
jgi:uncharacterized repeat protein (TIGR03803 family)